MAAQVTCAWGSCNREASYEFVVIVDDTEVERKALCDKHTATKSEMAFENYEGLIRASTAPLK